MKVFEEKERFSIKILFVKDEFTQEVRYISTKGKSEDEIFQEKLKVVDEISSTNFRFWFARKSIIQAYKEIEPRFEEIFNKDYTEDTANYNYTLTNDEKSFLDKCISFYRDQNH